MGNSKNEIQLRLDSFQVLNHFIDNGIDDLDSLGFRTRISLSIDTDEETVSVSLLIEVTPTEHSKKIFSSIETLTLFSINDLSSIKEKKMEDLKERLITIAYSTTRGALIAKSETNLLRKYPLPLLDPNSLEEET